METKVIIAIVIIGLIVMFGKDNLFHDGGGGKGGGGGTPPSAS